MLQPMILSVITSTHVFCHFFFFQEAETQKEREAFEKEYKDTQESYSTILDENIHNTKVARGNQFILSMGKGL